MTQMRRKSGETPAPGETPVPGEPFWRKPLAELDWRTRLKDPDAMRKITSERVIAAFDRLCAERQLPG